MGLWGTLLVWEFTSREFLGFRRESASPHGCQGSPVCTGGGRGAGERGPQGWGSCGSAPGVSGGGCIPWGLWPSLPGQRFGIWDLVSVHRMRVLGWPVAYTAPHLEDLGGTCFCPVN